MLLNDFAKGKSHDSAVNKRKEHNTMWAYKSVFYQIYPLGLCGAPFENDGVETHRINRISDWLPHIKELGADTVYFSPLFESDTHGYNTRDYFKIDCRLGTNEDFKAITRKCTIWVSRLCLMVYLIT